MAAPRSFLSVIALPALIVLAVVVMSSLFIVDNAKLPLQNIMRGIILNASGSDLALPLANMPPAETVKCAVIIVSVVPILCIYPFVQKYFAKGFLVGSVKE